MMSMQPHAPSTTAEPPGDGSPLTDFGLPITPEQRRAIFAAGKARGLDIDDLRALTPAGSISTLTRLQAAQLIDRLNAGTDLGYPKRRSRTPRRPKGVYAIATAAQRNKIEALRITLGWTPQQFGVWLSKRHHDHGRPMAKAITDGGDGFALNIDSTADAAAVIELLKAVLTKTGRARKAAEASGDDRQAAEAAVDDHGRRPAVSHGRLPSPPQEGTTSPPQGSFQT